MTFKEYGLQDANTLEATQSMIESRVIDKFLLNDQEILLRHLHKETAAWIDEYRRMQRRGCEHGIRLAANRIRRPRALRPVVPAHRTAALRQAAGQLDDRNEGVLRRDHPARRGGPRPTATSSRSTTCPTMS